MAITNRERVGKALELLLEGLAPFVERELKAKHAQGWFEQVKASVGPSQESLFKDEKSLRWDVASLLAVMWNQWGEVFKITLGQAERTLVSELRDIRNRWAHQNPFSGDDAYRAIDSVGRLLTAISATQSEEIEKMRMELLRVRFDEQVRGEKRKSAGGAIEGGTSLKPWREVINPHKDVASGRYQQAEFAADLWQVHLDEGGDEYRKPIEFFRRTYLTESLKRMLVNGIERISGKGGDPVVQLQTNFGGGKTHSMLALYHLFSGKPAGDLAGVDVLLKESGVNKIPEAKRVVLVGNKISPGNPTVKPDGVVVRTMWGELAWQLGGKKAFELIKADDEKATSPGDRLRELLNQYGPCLILIDEWVAYARQLHDRGDLPAGNFETQFTFAQALTESVKLVKNCMLVISLPASESTASPHAQSDDVEVGGQRGREALERLRNVVGRVESSWRPASAEEGFEIVRRRLFEPITDSAQFKDRDVVARAFADMYRTQSQEFPPDSKNADYENRLKAAYPIHPEIFDRLYTDWSTLISFQRTRGVLRLMAAVIHSLWEKGDKNPLIMPCNISIDEQRVQFELTRYLSENWAPIIDKDVDGPDSLSLQLDRDVPNLGKLSACRRVARTIYLGSAPTTAAAHRGIEDRQIKLGCVMPGESPAIFGDALRRLAGKATHLYQDGNSYWYSTRATVTKTAEDIAEQLKRDPDKVVQEIDRRLRMDLRNIGDFSRIHPVPRSGQDVPDDTDTRLVVLGIDYPYTKEPECAALNFAKTIFDQRGNSPRIYKNALVFLAPDKNRIQDLDEAVRRYLAWESILVRKDELDLSPHQVKQAEKQKESADGTVAGRLPETYQWLLVPAQSTPQDQVEWQAIKVSGQDDLAVRASKKLKNSDYLVTKFAASNLRRELDKIPLWRGDHVAIRQLCEDFGKYLYLPRLKNSFVLIETIVSGVELLTWEQDSFAYADSFDESAGRYRGLRCGKPITIPDEDAQELLVKPNVALKQFETESVREQLTPHGEIGAPSVVESLPDAAPSPISNQPKRFFGTVVLDTARVGRDAGRIADEVISHLAGLDGAKVKVTLEIEAEVPSGAPDNVVRTVTENSRTLKFTSQGFEKE